MTYQEMKILMAICFALAWLGMSFLVMVYRYFRAEEAYKPKMFGTRRQRQIFWLLCAFGALYPLYLAGVDSRK